VESSSVTFRAGMSRRLRRRGLRGNTVAVGFDGDTFGSIDYALADLRRVRIGVAQAGDSTYRRC
jgi:hypothetical protein